MPATIHIALGSNRRHGRYGAPAEVIIAAIAMLDAAQLAVTTRSPIRSTPPLGPRQRQFANAVVAVASDLPLQTILTMLQTIEQTFGRRPGRRWGPRVLDLDIITAGPTVTPARGWRAATRGLIVPHRGVAHRHFVLDPLTAIAGGWRHPVLHLTARQLRARLSRPKRSPAGGP